MSDLSPWSRQLIASARGSDDPTADAKHRVHEAVLRSAGASPPDDPSAAKTEIARSVGQGMALKVVLPAALAVAVGGAWVASNRAGPSDGTGAVASAVPVASPPPSPTLEPSPPADPADPSGDFQPPFVMATAATSAAIPAPQTSTRPPATSTPRAGISSRPASSLEEEVRLIREAQGALQGGDARTALRRLDEHERRFPSGMLTLERSGLRAVALCQEGAPGADASARAFVEKHGGTPMAVRVRAACRLAP